MHKLIIFLMAWLLSMMVTPLISTFTRKMKLLDHPVPNSTTKKQKEPIPLGGGLVVFFVGSIILFSLYGLTNNETILFLCSSCLLLLGIVDDMNSLSPVIRLLVEMMVSIAFLFGTYVIVPFAHPFVQFPIMTLWLMGITNSVNMMDNVDGVTGGVSFIILMTLSLIGGEIMSVYSLVLGGACLGFLWFNSPPAKIYLGDGGTLFLGFNIAGISLIQINSVATNPSHLFILPLMLSVPIIDTTIATLLRIKNNKPIYVADRSNITFLLQDRGWSNNGIVALQYGACMFSCITSVMLVGII